jgi:uncharacterized membrane protein
MAKFGIPKRYWQKLLDFERIEAAIAEAERHTSGEVRVSVAPWFWGNVERAADRAFIRLGMTQTKDRNGILFFIVPARRTFVVRGDEGIHQKVGQRFWDDIARTLSEHFARNEFTEGLVQAITEVGKQLGTHFPHQGERDRNELPNKVDLA